MKSKLMIFLLLISAVASQLMAGELEDVLAKHYEALGGKEALSKLNSMKATGKIVISSPQGDMEIPFTMLAKDGSKLKMESSFQGMQMVQGYDGTLAWQINPMMGSSAPQDMTADESKEMKRRADLKGDLVDYATKGLVLELNGKEEIEGTDTYKITVTEGEEKRFFYLDAENYVILKQASEVSMMGSKQNIESFPSEYKMVNGYLIAHSFSQKTGMGDMTLIMETVEINPEIDDAVFAKPVVEAETAQ